jgi:hypothetical protein
LSEIEISLSINYYGKKNGKIEIGKKFYGKYFGRNSPKEFLEEKKFGINSSQKFLSKILSKNIFPFFSKFSPNFFKFNSSQIFLSKILPNKFLHIQIVNNFFILIIIYFLI